MFKLECTYHQEATQKKTEQIQKANVHNIKKPQTKTERCSSLYNTKEPIVIAGDSKGCVHSLKLSPNLRQKTKV